MRICIDHITDPVLLRDMRRMGTTEHDLQYEYDKYSRAEMMQSYGASERQIETMFKESDEMNTYTTRHEPDEMYITTHSHEPAIPPKAPPPPFPAQCNRAADPAERVALIQLELAEAEAALAAENERNAFVAKIDAEIALVEATSTLLADIRFLRMTNRLPYRRKEFATYRKELTALAAAYDVKIVLVGDKSAAVLVLN